MYLKLNRDLNNLNFVKFLFFIFIFYLNFSCFSNSYELENYKNCTKLLEKERKKARIAKKYSYNPQKFLECRAPVHYKTE